MCKRIIICLVVMFSVLSFHTAIASTILEDSSQRSFLYPVCIDEQWGYIDDTGTIVITPSFYFAEPFRGSLAAVSIKTEQNQILFGIINTAGDYVVAPIWDRIESGYDGLLYGGETGFYYISDYDSGLVGYYNIGESFLCEPIYSDIFLWEYTDLLPAVKGGKMGYIDRCSGEWALEPVWDYTILDQANFSEGFALVGIMNKDDVQGILIDEQGHELSLPEGFESVTTFFEGYAIIRDTQGHYGYINTSGQCVLNPVWDYASPFSNGFAIVKKNGQSTIIDKEGT